MFPGNVLRKLQHTLGRSQHGVDSRGFVHEVGPRHLNAMTQRNLLDLTSLVVNAVAGYRLAGLTGDGISCGQGYVPQKIQLNHRGPYRDLQLPKSWREDQR